MVFTDCHIRRTVYCWNRDKDCYHFSCEFVNPFFKMYSENQILNVSTCTSYLVAEKSFIMQWLCEVLSLVLSIGG